jgi:ribosome-binding factor A
MESTRQKKVARLVQKELATYFLRESKTLYGGAFITVTTVRISPDLSHARVYLSLFKAADAGALLDQIVAEKKEIRKHLGEMVRKQLRIVPDLDFFLDDSLDYFEKIDKLLKNNS